MENIDNTLSIREREKEYEELKSLILGFDKDSPVFLGDKGRDLRDDLLDMLAEPLMASSFVRTKIQASFLDGNADSNIINEVYSIVGIYVAKKLQKDFNDYDIQKASLLTHLKNSIEYFALNLLKGSPEEVNIALFNSWIEGSLDEDPDFLKGATSFEEFLSTKEDVRETIYRFYVRFLKRRNYKGIERENIGKQTSINSKYVKLLSEYYAKNSGFELNLETSYYSFENSKTKKEFSVKTSTYDTPFEESMLNKTKDEEFQIRLQQGEKILDTFLGEYYDTLDVEMKERFSSYKSSTVVYNKSANLIAFKLLNIDTPDKELLKFLGIKKRRLRDYSREYKEIFQIVGMKEVASLMKEVKEEIMEKDVNDKFKIPSKTR